VVQQQELDAEGLPPLVPPEASDDERGRAIEARMVARYGALLHCAKLGQAGSLIRVGQIVRVSSSKVAWTRRLTVSSVPSS
jgi:hypothetical protein